MKMSNNQLNENDAKSSFISKIEHIPETTTVTFLQEKHAKYFMRFLQLLPARLATHDCTRGTIVFYAICGLDVLNSLNLITNELRQNIINWIYGNLVTPQTEEPCCAGFQGSRVVVIRDAEQQLLDNIRCYQWGHLAMTYTSIGILLTLGDNLERLNRKTIVDGVAAVQRNDGSFSPYIVDGENDMRFVFCAAAICHMLDYWGQVDREKMYQFIMNSLRYDCSFSQHTDGEGHGGTTYCALAALQLSNMLPRLKPTTIENIKRWCLFRQVDGFQGRPNKPVDTCYSFWIGASLRILNAFQLTDYNANRSYILETQDNRVGGFAKWPDYTTDPYHTYLGICGLSFIGETNLNGVMPSLNISMPAYEHLKRLHIKWLSQANHDIRDDYHYKHEYNHHHQHSYHNRHIQDDEVKYIENLNECLNETKLTITPITKTTTANLVHTTNYNNNSNKMKKF